MTTIPNWLLWGFIITIACNLILMLWILIEDRAFEREHPETEAYAKRIDRPFMDPKTMDEQLQDLIENKVGKPKFVKWVKKDDD